MTWFLRHSSQPEKACGHQMLMSRGNAACRPAKHLSQHSCIRRESLLLSISRRKQSWPRKRRRRGAVLSRAGVNEVLRWNANSPAQVAELLRNQLQRIASQSLAVAKMHSWLWGQPAPTSLLSGLPCGHILSGKQPLLRIWAALKHILRVLAQPLGGRPISVIQGVPGWNMKPVRGHRRWLGLRSGKLQPVPDAGPWWTPSGILHFIQSIPVAIWLLAGLFLVHTVINNMRKGRKERDSLVEQRTLRLAAKSTDLRVQKNRMMRALGATVEADAPGVEVIPAAEHQWQDPSEWDEVTRQQWDEFMRKSRTMKLRRDQWWQITSGDDTPYHKLAHDRLTKEGKLPDYNG